MDIIRELRLRCWARENYVPPADRRATWDPVVLDEMATRDAELAREELIRAATRIVPLAPITYAIDEPHDGPDAPHFLMLPAHDPVAGLPQWGLFVG